MNAGFRMLAAVAALSFVALACERPAHAQSPNPQCGTTADGADPRTGGDACQRAVDLFNYMTPQIGMLLAGGNATLGQTSVLGGLGHFAVSVRANVTGDFRIPSLDAQDLDVGPVRQSTFEVQEQGGGFPVVDAAIGLFAGMPAGPTRVGGVDALVNVFYLPGSIVEGMDGEDLSVGMPGGGLELGWGLRVGLIEESAMLPGASFTYIRRALPALDLVSANVGDESLPGTGYSDTLSLRNFSIRTSAWRVVAGKRLAMLGLAAGIGQDRYGAEGRLNYVVEDGLTSASGQLDFSPSTTATNAFVGLSLNLFMFTVAGELGRISGGAVETYNQFSIPSDEPRTYGAVGLRFSM